MFNSRRIKQLEERNKYLESQVKDILWRFNKLAEILKFNPGRESMVTILGNVTEIPARLGFKEALESYLNIEYKKTEATEGYVEKMYFGGIMSGGAFPPSSGGGGSSTDMIIKKGRKSNK